MKYFWSDLHFESHKTAPVGQRKKFFSSQEEWQKKCIDILHSNLKTGDILYLLGDIGDKDGIVYLKNILPRKVQYIMLMGNHDPPKSFCKTVFGRDQVRDTLMVRFSNRQFCFLSHYPHLFWNKSHYGSYHLYGHVHDQRTEFIMNLLPEIQSLDVCPESSIRHLGEARPFSEEDVVEILSKRKGHDDVKYYEQFHEDL